jgi:hypothetical protein
VLGRAPEIGQRFARTDATKIQRIPTMTIMPGTRMIASSKGVHSVFRPRLRKWKKPRVLTTAHTVTASAKEKKIRPGPPSKSLSREAAA